MGPSTIWQISSISFLKSFFSFATREGLVVTPSINPSAADSLISAIFAESKKNFISLLLYVGLICGACARGGRVVSDIHNRGAMPRALLYMGHPLMGALSKEVALPPESGQL